MRFAWLARKLNRTLTLAPPPTPPRVFSIASPPASAFSIVRKPFLVVEDERGCAFGLVDLKRVDGEVLIDSFTYISPADADVTDLLPKPPKFWNYRLQGRSVLFLDRNGRVEARIEVQQ